MKVVDISTRASQLYLSGLSVDAVASELEVSYRTARKAILYSGTILRDPSQRLVGRTRPKWTIKTNKGIV
jgi:orotate phosphoribosyltransferase-like protein